MNPIEHMVRALVPPEKPKRIRTSRTPPDVKQAAVYDMKYGDRITAVAMRYGISRRALGRWLKEAA